MPSLGCQVSLWAPDAKAPRFRSSWFGHNPAVGMFDEYQPRRSFRCPACSEPVDDWQGKDGPCALVRWIEGERLPVETVEEQGRDADFMGRFSLPASFEIYAYCSNRHEVDADCTCENGIWSATELNPARSRERSEALRSLGKIYGSNNPSNSTRRAQSD